MPALTATVKRVGHKGADLIAPGNTGASFDAALAAGVDMIEFDVLPSRTDGRLLLAHDYKDLGGREALTLEQGLEHLASSPFEAVELDVDLKLPGYELRVLAALRAYGLLERALISSQFRESLALIRALEPGRQARLVGPEAAARPVPEPPHVVAGVAADAGMAGGAAAARGARDQLGAVRRADGPLAVDHAAAGAPRASGGRRAVCVDRR